MTELHELVSEVVGPGDPVWQLQVQTARGVLAAGGIPATELAEWTSVESRSSERADSIDAGTLPTVALSPRSGAT